MVPNAPCDAAPRRVLSADVAERIDACLRSTEGAVSANTQRAVKADLTVFAAWCGARELEALPATAAAVAAFVDAMARVRAPATVRRYVASIAAAHNALGHGRPVRSAAVRVALKRMHRRRGRRQKQALGLTWPLCERLLEAAGERVIDARNRALVAVAYDGMLRRSELALARVADVLEDARGSATLLVRHGKTDPEGRGAAVYLARGTVVLLRAWQARGGVRDGRLFRSVTKGDVVGEHLHPSQIPRIFKAMARRAGLPPEVVEGLSGHSARVGAVQDMVASGIEMPAIPAGGALEDDGDGDPLRGTPACAAQRRRPARAPAAARLGGRVERNGRLGGEAGRGEVIASENTCGRVRPEPGGKPRAGVSSVWSGCGKGLRYQRVARSPGPPRGWRQGPADRPNGNKYIDRLAPHNYSYRE